MDVIKNIDNNVETLVTGIASVNTNLNSLNTTSVPIVDPLVTVFNAQTFPKSPDSGYTTACTPFDTSLVKKLTIMCTNSGSTNLTILVYGHSAADSTDYVTLYPLTLDTSTTTGGCCIVNTYPYTTIKVINNDTVNAATVTIKYSKTR